MHTVVGIDASGAAPFHGFRSLELLGFAPGGITVVIEILLQKWRNAAGIEVHLLLTREIILA